MTQINAEDFTAFFRALYGHDREPFPWQMRLVRPVMLHAPEWLLRRVVAAARTSE